MAVKKTGISPDLIIHPGETIADILEERGITQAELATRTDVTAAYVSNVISGKKNISAKFALSLEYALGVPRSFWLNLQANYDAELLALTEEYTITENEKKAYRSLSEVIEHLRQRKMLPNILRMEDTILTLRKALQISSIENLASLVPEGAFRIASNTSIDPYVLGAWLRLCQIIGEKSTVSSRFHPENTTELISAIKDIMRKHNCDVQQELAHVMRQYGIDFSVEYNFKGAPVHGYITQRKDGTYQMVLTIRGSYADIFWFSLFHELGHIVNGDISKGTKFIDISDNDDTSQERNADLFACNALLDSDCYNRFIENGDFTISSICRFATHQKVMPYIVIGRLQKDGHIPYSWYSNYKLRYKWA